MKKWMIIVFCLLLVACNDNIVTAETPENALQLLDSKNGYPKIVKVLNSLQINDAHVICVFEGDIDNQSEWFVASIKKNKESTWFVHESINIGLPKSKDGNYSAGTNTFTAGISNKSEDKQGNRKVVNIPDNDYFVWIELNENGN